MFPTFNSLFTKNTLSIKISISLHIQSFVDILLWTVNLTFNLNHIKLSLDAKQEIASSYAKAVR